MENKPNVLLNMENSLGKEVHVMPNLAKFLSQQGFECSNWWEHKDTPIVIHPFNNVSVNTCYRFYDFAIHTKEVEALQTALEILFENYCNKVKYQKRGSFLRLWLYWDT